MIVFKSITWKNFLSTGNSPTTVYLNRSPTTLIIGKNGDGKSTILDALCFSLFGKAFRNINKSQIINSINQKNCVTEIEFCIGSTEYKVIRGIKPNVFEIYQNGNLINQDAASKDYQKVLEQQILKLNYKTFTQVVILGSASFVPFMQLPGGQRREVIEDILDIKIFSTMNSLLKEKIQQTKEEIARVESQIQISKSEVESQRKIIANMVASKQEHITNIRTRISSNEDQIRVLDARAKKLLDKTIELRTAIEDQGTLEEHKTTLREDFVKYRDKDETIDTQMKFFDVNDECPSCAQNIPHEHKQSLKDKLTKERETTRESLLTIKNSLEEVSTKLKEIDLLNGQLLELNIDISTTNSSISTLMAQNKSLSEEITTATNDTNNIDEEKKRLKELAETAMVLIDEKTVLSEHRTLQEISYNLLKDTGVKTAIIREYLPAMNKLINMYLQAMDFFVHFELDESFNETIKSRHRDEFTYASFSEGEKMRIDLAILFTWRQIARMKNSVNTNLLILDEIFDSSLDNSGTDYFLNVMNQVGEKTNVFVISHKGDQLFDKFRSIVKFEKKNDFSVMV